MCTYSSPCAEKEERIIVDKRETNVGQNRQQLVSCARTTENEGKADKFDQNLANIFTLRNAPAQTAAGCLSEDPDGDRACFPPPGHELYATPVRPTRQNQKDFNFSRIVLGCIKTKSNIKIKTKSSNRRPILQQFPISSRPPGARTLPNSGSFKLPKIPRFQIQTARSRLYQNEI